MTKQNNMGIFILELPVKICQIPLPAEKQNGISIMQNFLLITAFLMINLKACMNQNKEQVCLFNSFAGIAIIYFLSWFIWISRLYCPGSHKRNRCTKSVRCKCYGIIQLSCNRFYKTCFYFYFYCHSHCMVYVMNKWLQDFAYKINIGWLMYLCLQDLLAIAIALSTISFQAIKAAMANPVKSLRTE